MNKNTFPPLPTPNELLSKWPLSERLRLQIQGFRNTIAAIISGRSSQFLIIMGPCSVDEESAALEYALRIRSLQQQLPSDVLLCMRVYCEKPRSRFGWKGYAYPDAFESNPCKTLERARVLMLKIAALEVPIATEFLDPFLRHYYQDAVSWGSIGARTASSQTHRQMASDVDFPMGIKNTEYGEIEGAINGVYAAAQPQGFFGMDEEGRVSFKKSSGNPYAHVVLRGGINGPNAHPAVIEETAEKLKHLQLPSRLIIDCAHGNSNKHASGQALHFREGVALIRQGHPSLCGLMIESYLEEGQQIENALVRRYGVSITDPCLSWEQTEHLFSCLS